MNIGSLFIHSVWMNNFDADKWYGLKKGETTMIYDRGTGIDTCWTRPDHYGEITSANHVCIIERTIKL